LENDIRNLDLAHLGDGDQLSQPEIDSALPKVDFEEIAEIAQKKAEKQNSLDIKKEGSVLGKKKMSMIRR
jgi:hypothetical protein